MMRTLKERQTYSFSLALNNDKKTYDNECQAFVYRENLMKCSIKEALLKEFFFFVFVFKFIVHFLTTLCHLLPLSQ